MWNTFHSAVRGADGQVDAGYLAMVWVMVAVITVIPVMLIGSLVEMLFSPTHVFRVQELGVGIGSVCGGFGVAIGAVGAFRAGDKPRPGTTTTTVEATRTTVDDGKAGKP